MYSTTLCISSMQFYTMTLMYSSHDDSICKDTHSDMSKLSGFVVRMFGFSETSLIEFGEQRDGSKSFIWTMSLI